MPSVEELLCRDDESWGLDTFSVRWLGVFVGVGRIMEIKATAAEIEVQFEAELGNIHYPQYCSKVLHLHVYQNIIYRCFSNKMSTALLV